MNSTLEALLFPITLGIIAVLYACVGQAGATGYIAIMGPSVSILK